MLHDRMIEEEVEDNRERLLKNDSEADVERKLFQDDNQNEGNFFPRFFSFPKCFFMLACFG